MKPCIAQPNYNPTWYLPIWTWLGPNNDPNNCCCHDLITIWLTHDLNLKGTRYESAINLTWHYMTTKDNLSRNWQCLTRSNLKEETNWARRIVIVSDLQPTYWIWWPNTAWSNMTWNLRWPNMNPTRATEWTTVNPPNNFSLNSNQSTKFLDALKSM